MPKTKEHPDLGVDDSAVGFSHVLSAIDSAIDSVAVRQVLNGGEVLNMLLDIRLEVTG